jgi:hypothetical protein
MQRHYHVSHFTDTEVTDVAVIARLENDDPPEKDAGIDRPVVMKSKKKSKRRKV